MIRLVSLRSIARSIVRNISSVDSYRSIPYNHETISYYEVLLIETTVDEILVRKCWLVGRAWSTSCTTTVIFEQQLPIRVPLTSPYFTQKSKPVREREQLNRVTITEPLTSVMERRMPQNDDIWISRKRRARHRANSGNKTYIICQSRRKCTDNSLTIHRFTMAIRVDSGDGPLFAFHRADIIVRANAECTYDRSCVNWADISTICISKVSLRYI